MKLIGMVCLIAVTLTGPASAWENRVNAAVHLFETVCVPIVYGKSWKSIARANGAKHRQNSRANTRTTNWEDAVSGFSVQVTEHADGRILCYIDDNDNALPLRGRKKLESLVAKRILKLLPMLKNVKETPKGQLAYHNAWMYTRYSGRLEDRLGVIHTRARSKENGFTLIKLVFPGMIPTA